jgi:DNA replication protein DnaC
MTSTFEQAPRGGYAWGMTDSRKLDERLDATVARAFQDAAENWDRTKRDVPEDSTRRDRKADAERRNFRAMAARAAATPHADDDAYDRADAEIWREWNQRKAEVMAARIPDVYRDAVARTPEAADWLAGYRAQSRAGLVIMGETGTGKTWEAMAIARELLVTDHVPVQVVTAPELLAALRPGGDGLSDIGQFQAAPVLVLDDLGTEKVTDWGAEQMLAVASYRASRGLPVIVTTNLKPAEIHARYDRRLIERLFGGSKMIVMRGQSLRPLPF